MLKPIYKSDGVTDSERQMSKLLNDTFLSLWSYVGPCNDRNLLTKNEGVEICDAIVAFGNKIIIFSDKDNKFNENIDVNTSWKRWYKDSVKKSINQLYGAESWIRNNPHRVFLDKKCQNKFPFDLSNTNLEIHLVALTKNTLDPAKKYFDQFEVGSTGTLAYMYNLEEKNILEKPFILCDINPQKTFVHVFDEASIKLVINELGTISDFLNYLKVKEKLIRKIGLTYVFGEEDLLGYYLDDKSFLLGRSQFSYLDNMNGEYEFGIKEGYWNHFRESENFKLHNTLKEMSLYWGH